MDGTLSAEETLQLFLPTVYDTYRDSFTADYRHYLQLGRSPDRAAREALASTCHNLCRKYVNSILRDPAFRNEHEDAYGEALAAVANAARLFRPEGDARFGTYAARAIIRDVGKYRDLVCRRGFSYTEGVFVPTLVSQQKALQCNYHVDYIETWFDGLFAAADDSESTWESWDDSIWERIQASIPGSRQKVMLMMRFREGLTFQKIADRFDLSVNRAVQLVNSALTMLKWKVLNGYLRLPDQEEYLDGSVWK